MPSPISLELMARAIELSKCGFPAPNPRVGCVIEKDGEIVGEGFHDHAGGPHAEIVALHQAGDRAERGTVYVTLEPCNHQGRTGPCSHALIAANVARVVVAVKDPNLKASGGSETLRAAGIEVIEGVNTLSAIGANHDWLTAMRLQRPFIVGKTATSLDGRIALPSGESKWITGEESRRQAHILRAECGAVLVGRTTVQLDDPELSVRHIQVVNQPARFVLDSGGKLHRDCKVFQGDEPATRIVARASHHGDVEVRMAGHQFDLADLAEKLFGLGVTSLLVEGGATTLGSFLEAKLCDRLEMFIAPRIFGDGPPWAAFAPPKRLADLQNWQFASPRLLGTDLWITAFPSSVE
jgi:diaminohydroxyphosphoribosylaminopyrimidine deaminase/5-amino-6-(5-phosphoribosylamino)uracil reductase